MQTTDNATTAIVADTSSDTATGTTTTETPVATVTETPVADAPAPVKASRKRAPKAATPVIEAAPVADKPVSSFADERAAAAIAVGEFYSGASLPFKSAQTRLSDFNPANVKRPSARTGALVAAMLAYAPSGAIASDGTFTRGCFRVPARLLNPSAKAGELLAAMPESGCFGNMHGRVITHVSGPIGGKNARDGVFKLDFAGARAELQLIGDKLAKPALRVLAKLAA